MTKILVLHGAGMNMRGKVQTEIFGTMTLPEYDAHIKSYAKELGVDIEIYHSNIEGEIVNAYQETPGPDGVTVFMLQLGLYTAWNTTVSSFS